MNLQRRSARLFSSAQLFILYLCTFMYSLYIFRYYWALGFGSRLNNPHSIIRKFISIYFPSSRMFLSFRFDDVFFCSLSRYGWERSRYVYALISGCGIFFLGCGFSVYHGIAQIIEPAPLEHLHTVRIYIPHFYATNCLNYFSLGLLDLPTYYGQNLPKNRVFGLCF